MSQAKASLDIDKEHMWLRRAAAVFFSFLIGVDIYLDVEWYGYVLTILAWYQQLRVFKADVRMRKACVIG